MSAFEELDKLSSEELHDRAWHHAKRHLNVKFFWNLLELVPAAMTGTGDVGQGESDVQHPSGQVADALDEDPELKEALRPVYIDYLRQHPGA